MKNGRANKCLLGIAALFAIAVPFSTFFFVPQYAEMFSGFPELWPTRTRVVSSYYPASLLFPVVVALVWRYWPNKAFRGAAALSVSVIAGTAIIWLCYWSMTPSELVLEAIRRSN
jgi:hypothetical protein